MYYPSSENKGADQLRGYREADLRLCFRICKRWFSQDAAHMSDVPKLKTYVRSLEISNDTLRTHK